MDDPLTLWCATNEISSVAAKLRDVCGLTNPNEFLELDQNDIEGIIKDCSMNVGEKARFRRAVKQILQPESRPPQQLEPLKKAVPPPPNPLHCAQEDLSASGLVRKMSYFDINETGTLLPFDAFSQEFSTNLLPDVHEAVKRGLGKKYNPNVHEPLISAVKSHLLTSQRVLDFCQQRNLTPNEGGALVYYTADAKRFFGTQEESIYSIVNPLLALRNKRDIADWQPFLYYLCSAEDKLPSVSGKFYRAINVPLTAVSKQYKAGNEVVWPAVTSVSREKSILAEFSDGDLRGMTFLPTPLLFASSILLLPFEC